MFDTFLIYMYLDKYTIFHMVISRLPVYRVQVELYLSEG